MVHEHSTRDRVVHALVFVLEGNHNEICDVISRHATVPDFLKYGEDMQATPVSPKLITPFKEMWKELRQIHKRMTWSQSDMVKVFEEVADKNGSTWPRELTGSEKKDFSVRMSKRFRVMARHINQSMVKKRGWVLEMLGDHDAAVAGGNVKATKDVPRKRPASATEYTYGFDHVTGKAFRQCERGKRVFTDIIIGDDDDANPTAIFMENDEPVQITAVKNAELRDRRHVMLASRGSIWEGTTTDGERLRVARLPESTCYLMSLT